MYVRERYKSPDTPFGSLSTSLSQLQFVYQWIEALAGPINISSPKVQASVSESATSGPRLLFAVRIFAPRILWQAGCYFEKL